MKSTKGNSSSMNEEEDYDEEFSAQKDGASNSKDSKNSDRAHAIRSKHSVTEQRRRGKINERFQTLRDLIPHGDHKRDTASFLLEVIEYVQILQEKAQSYEDSYPAWGPEPTKFMSWRHSHWRNQGLLAQPLSVYNPERVGNGQIPLESDANQNTYNSSLGEPQSDLVEKVPSPLQLQMPLSLGEPQSDLVEKVPSPLQLQMPLSVHDESMCTSPSQGLNSDPQSTDCPVMSNSRADEHSIEGGTISISSIYSQELLNTLTQALQSSGVDLSNARISIQIDLGKRASQALASDIPHVKEHENASCNLGVEHQGEGIGQQDEQQDHKRLRSR